MGPGAKAVDNAVIILFVLRRSGGRGEEVRV